MRSLSTGTAQCCEFVVKGDQAGLLAAVAQALAGPDSEFGDSTGTSAAPLGPARASRVLTWLHSGQPPPQLIRQRVQGLSRPGDHSFPAPKPPAPPPPLYGPGHPQQAQQHRQPPGRAFGINHAAAAANGAANLTHQQPETTIGGSSWPSTKTS